jgi:hypothetical protein
MPDHAADSQSEAFREAAPDELVTDEQIEAMLRSGELIDGTGAPRVSIDDYEFLRWDAARVGPKTLDEARAALAARVDDPSAPDNDPHAYDEV